MTLSQEGATGFWVEGKQCSAEVERGQWTAEGQVLGGSEGEMERGQLAVLKWGMERRELGAWLRTAGVWVESVEEAFPVGEG